MAAVHRDDVNSWELYYDANVRGAQNVCDLARERKVKTIVFTSSVAIYGFAAPGTDEEGAPNYFNDYGKSKFLAEQVYKEWQAEDPHGRTLVIIRPTVIFGEGNRGNVYNLLNQIRSRRFIMIGRGENTKSMAYVGNVSHFIKHCLSKPPGLHIYNYTDVPDMSMNTLVGLARERFFGLKGAGLRVPLFVGLVVGRCFDFFSSVVGTSLPISSIRVQKFTSTTSFSSEKMQLEFNPPFDMTEAIKGTIEYEFFTDNSNRPSFDAE